MLPAIKAKNSENESVTHWPDICVVVYPPKKREAHTRESKPEKSSHQLAPYQSSSSVQDNVTHVCQRDKVKPEYTKKHAKKPEYFVEILFRVLKNMWPYTHATL